MFKKSFFFVLFFGLFGSFVNAQIDPMNLPKLTQYVSDFSNVLDSNVLAELNWFAQSYDQQTTHQIVAVLIPNRNGRELFDIWMKIFNENAIWQARKNNGLLLLISTEEKKIRIVVGYGLEWQMPDLLTSRIIEEDIRPLVNNWDFSGAVHAFYERSIRAIDTNEYQTIPSSTSQNNSENLWIIGLILWFIFTMILKKKRLTKKWFTRYLWIFLILILLWLVIWLSITVLFGFLAGIFFAFTGIMPGRGWFGGGWISFGGWGGFSGWGWSSGGGWSGD
jgi:uncharacterized protein